MNRYARFVLTLLVVVTMVGIAGPATAAPACSLVPQLRDVTVNQGLGSYTPLVRGKEALVRFYLSMPSCAGGGVSMSVKSASLTVKRGTTTLSSGIGSTPTIPTAGPFPPIPSYGSAPLLDGTGDPKFVVPGSVLAPAGTTGQFSATFSATIGYQAKSGGTTRTGTATFTTSATVDKGSNALRVLVVPFGDPSQSFASQFSDAATAALQNAMTTLSRTFPVPDGVTSTLTSTSGGIRYQINPSLLDLTSVIPGYSGTFCGTGSNFNALKAELAQFLQSWNTANPGTTADRVLGVVDEAISNGSSAGCAEGMASMNSPESWIRAKYRTSPSDSGALASMELAHTFGLVLDARDDAFSPGHSPFVQADGSAPNRGYNVSLRSFLSDDHTVMTLSGVWNNNTTIFEKVDYENLHCQLGGTANTECLSSGTVGSSTGVAAGPTFVMSGTTDGTAAGTSVLESYFSPDVARTTPSSSSQYRLVQKDATTVLRNDGVPVSFSDTNHGGEGDGVVGLFSIAFPFDTSATKIQLWKGPPDATGSLLLYERNKDAAPVIQTSTIDSVDITTSGAGRVLSPGVSRVPAAGLSDVSLTQVSEDQPDLKVGMSDDPDPAATGEDITYSIRIKNDPATGSAAATNVTLTDVVPPGMSFEFAESTQGDCVDDPSSDGETVTCSLDTINVGEFVDVTIILFTDTVGMYTNTVDVTESEADATPADNTASEETTVLPPGVDLSLTDTDDPDPVTAGDTLTYTLVITNNGPEDATGVALHDGMDADTTVQSVQPTSNCDFFGTSVDCNWEFLAVGDTFTVTIEVTADQPGTVEDDAFVESEESDPALDNNSASASTTVNESSGVQTSVEVTDDHPNDVRVDFRAVCPGVSYILDVAEPLDEGGTATETSNPGPMCDDAQVVAFATDGFQTDTEPTGDTVDNPPSDDAVASIYGPSDGDTFLQYEAVALNGGANHSTFKWSFDGSPIAGATRATFDAQPPSGGWPTSGSHTFSLEVTAPNGSTDTATVSVHFDADNDNDGIPASQDETACVGGASADNDPTNSYADSDGDGVPNQVEYTRGTDPCVAETKYEAITDFNPDTLNIPSTGQSVTVLVTVPYRNVNDVLGTSVRITELAGRDVTFANTGWTIDKSGKGVAKFDRQAIINFLVANGIRKQRVAVVVEGASKPAVTPAWTFKGEDSFFVT